MNICGIMVQMHPENYGQVRERLLDIPGVEVHAINQTDGRTVVTLEETEMNRMADSMFAIERTPGVIAATLIYHHNEAELAPESQSLA
jgi:nitrate reductase NapD